MEEIVLLVTIAFLILVAPVTNLIALIIHLIASRRPEGKDNPAIHGGKRSFAYAFLSAILLAFLAANRLLGWGLPNSIATPIISVAMILFSFPAIDFIINWYKGVITQDVS